MKKFLVLFGILMGLTPAAFSAPENPIEFSLQAGGIYPQEAQRINQDKDSRYYFNGRLMYDLCHHMAVGADIGWMRFTDRPNGVKSGHLYEVPLMGDLILKYPIPETDNRVVPYAIGGAGVAIGGYDEDQAVSNAGVKVKMDTEFAYKGGIGVQFFITKQMAVFAEGTYLHTKFDPKVEGGSIGGKIKTNSYLAGAGLTLAF